MARSTATSLARSLIAGAVLATMMAVLALVGATLGVVSLWPVLLAAGLGMVVGVPRATHVVAAVAGALVAALGAGLQLAVLPVLPAARAGLLATSVLVLALITGLSRGRLPLGVALVGWGTTTALLEPALAVDPTAFVTIAPLTVVTVLAGFGLGLLAAQVVALLGATVSDGRSGSAASIALVVLAVTAVVTVPVQAQVLAQAASVGAPPGWTGAGRGGRIEGEVSSLAHRQVVLVPSAPDGDARDGLVITQLHVRGSGPVRIVLEDQAVSSLRDVTAFRAPRVEGTSVVHDLDLAGAAVVRTVATLERELPVELSVGYVLDGLPLTPEELVGRTGRLSITYTLTNRTAEPREVRFFDGLGRPRTQVREVAVPMGATLAVRLDPRFGDVVADGASVVAGDGTGGTQVNASLALFGPSGAATRSFVLHADVVDAIAPAAAIRVVPLGARTSPDWRASEELLARFAGALGDASVASALLGTTSSALGASVPLDGTTSDVLLDQLATIVAGLGGALNDGAAGVDANLAWLAAQDARFEAGEGFVHGVLADADDVTVVYAFEVAGLGDDGGPSMPVRLLVGLALFAVVGLLGRSVGGHGPPARVEG